MEQEINSGTENKSPKRWVMILSLSLLTAIMILVAILASPFLLHDLGLGFWYNLVSLDLEISESQWNAIQPLFIITLLILILVFWEFRISLKSEKPKVKHEPIIILLSLAALWLLLLIYSIFTAVGHEGGMAILFGGLLGVPIVIAFLLTLLSSYTAKLLKKSKTFLALAILSALAITLLFFAAQYVFGCQYFGSTDECYENVAYTSTESRPELCEKLSDQHQSEFAHQSPREQCYENLSRIFGEAHWCQKIEFKEYREDCLLDIRNKKEGEEIHKIFADKIKTFGENGLNEQILKVELEKCRALPLAKKIFESAEIQEKNVCYRVLMPLNMQYYDGNYSFGIRGFPRLSGEWQDIPCQIPENFESEVIEKNFINCLKEFSPRKKSLEDYIKSCSRLVENDSGKGCVSYLYYSIDNASSDYSYETFQRILREKPDNIINLIKN